jgi:hypothetical protein
MHTRVPIRRQAHQVVCVISSEADSQEHHLHTGTDDKDVSGRHEDSRLDWGEPNACDELLLYPEASSSTLVQAIRTQATVTI